MSEITVAKPDKNLSRGKGLPAALLVVLLLTSAIALDLFEFLISSDTQSSPVNWIFLDATVLGVFLLCLFLILRGEFSLPKTALAIGFAAAFLTQASHMAAHIYQTYAPNIHAWLQTVLCYQLTMSFLAADIFSRYSQSLNAHKNSFVAAFITMMLLPALLLIAVSQTNLPSETLEVVLFILLALQFSGYLFSISSSRMKSPVPSSLIYIFLFLSTLLQLIEARILQDLHMPGSLFLLLIGAFCVQRLQSLSTKQFDLKPYELRNPIGIPDLGNRDPEYRDEQTIALQSASFLRAYAELSEERDLVSRASEDKSNYLAMMSHEIRTPMNAVIGTLQLIADTELDDDQNSLVKTARQSANSMLMLLNNILDYSHLESGNMSLEYTDFNLSEEIHGIINIYHEYAVTKHLTLNPVILNDANISGDIVRIRQIFGNLINNAIKFSEQGTIRVKAELTKTEDGIYRLTGSVSDQGIGMTEEEQSKLFMPFTQAHSGISSKFGGTGLGLSICRHLCELMGGDIRVCSATGIGTEFVFSIFCKPAVSSMLQQSHELTANSAIEPERLLNVLLAEDSNANREVISKILEKAGHNVTGVANGLDAVQSAASGTYDIILMDIQMPEMDGVEALKRIRCLPDQAGQIPVIALTANALQGDREKYIQQGMDGYLAKPVRAKDLFSVLSQVPSRN